MRLSHLALSLVLIVPTAVAAPKAPQSRDDFRKEYVRPEAIPFPAENPYSAEKAQLGEMLFFDPRLSGSNWISCASCHNPALSWGDGLPRGIGHGMKTLGRRTPTILNLAWAEGPVMWDGRKTGLEDQVFGPVTSPAEMAASVDKVVGRISEI